MMDLQEFLTLPGTIFDVRSPGEYHHARLPGALNLPLFNDEERAAVGTVYKLEGKSQAIELGLQLVGPKLAHFVREVKKQHQANGPVKIHCWRGGMRSSSMAWLMNTAGIPAVTLSGGYKTFRRWVLSTLEKPYKFLVLGGFTGSGKTAMLQAYKNSGKQAVDLEALAAHKGSTFGMLHHPFQPSIEQFENELAFSLSKLDPEEPIWIEDESRMIGKCKIPDPIFHQMRSAPLFFLEVPIEERMERLSRDYGGFSPELLIEATQRLARRLGGLKTQQICELIQKGDLKAAITSALEYYDATYKYGLSRRTHPKEVINAFNFQDLME